MSIVYDPSLGMDSSKSVVGGGTTPFMAPELLVPSRFGLDKCLPSKEADIYAMAMVVYQVRVSLCLTYARADSSLVGTHRNATVRETGRARGRIQGRGRGETLKTHERIRTWPL